MKNIKNIIETTTAPVNTNNIWLDKGVLKVFKNGNWESINDNKEGQELKEEVETLNTKVTKVEKDLNSLSSVPTDISTIKGNITATNKSVSDNSKAIETNKGNINTNKNSITTIQNNISTINSDIKTVKSSLSTTDSNVSTIQSSITTINTNINNINKNVTTINTSIEKLDSDIKNRVPSFIINSMEAQEYDINITEGSVYDQPMFKATINATEDIYKTIQRGSAFVIKFTRNAGMFYDTDKVGTSQECYMSVADSNHADSLDYMADTTVSWRGTMPLWGLKVWAEIYPLTDVVEEEAHIHVSVYADKNSLIEYSEGMENNDVFKKLALWGVKGIIYDGMICYLCDVSIGQITVATYKSHSSNGCIKVITFILLTGEDSSDDITMEVSEEIALMPVEALEKLEEGAESTAIVNKINDIIVNLTYSGVFKSSET